MRVEYNIYTGLFNPQVDPRHNDERYVMTTILASMNAIARLGVARI